MVAVPQCAPPHLQTLGVLELRPKESGNDVAGKEGGAEIDPCVLVDLAAQETAAIGALLAQDFGPANIGRIVYQQRASLAGNEILGFVEADCGEIADAAERPT